VLDWISAPGGGETEYERGTSTSGRDGGIGGRKRGRSPADCWQTREGVNERQLTSYLKAAASLSELEQLEQQYGDKF
jgi:hypothetical protein